MVSLQSLVEIGKELIRHLHDSADVVPSLDLSPCEGLEDLHLTAILRANEPDTIETDLNTIARIFSSMTHAKYPELKQIVFNIHVQHKRFRMSDMLNQRDWDPERGLRIRPPSADTLDNALLAVLSRGAIPRIPIICTTSDPFWHRKAQKAEVVEENRDNDTTNAIAFLDLNTFVATRIFSIQYKTEDVFSSWFPRLASDSRVKVSYIYVPIPPLDPEIWWPRRL